MLLSQMFPVASPDQYGSTGLLNNAAVQTSVPPDDVRISPVAAPQFGSVGDQVTAVH